MSGDPHIVAFGGLLRALLVHDRSLAVRDLLNTRGIQRPPSSTFPEPGWWSAASVTAWLELLASPASADSEPWVVKQRDGRRRVTWALTPRAEEIILSPSSIADIVIVAALVRELGHTQATAGAWS